MTVAPPGENYVISPPVSDSLRSGLKFYCGFIFFFRRVISELRDQKHAKFGPISVDFEVWWRISPERMKVFKINELLVRQRFLPR